MPKTIEDVKSALTGLDDGQELCEALSSAILHERNTGKGLVRETQGKLTAYIDGLKLLGFDPVTSDIGAFVAGLSEKLKGGTEAKKKLTADQQQIADLKKSVETLTTKWTASEQKAGDFRSKYTMGILKDQLLTRMQGKIYSAEVRAKDIIREGQVILDEDGKTAKWKDGDEVTDLEKGLQGYFDANKDDLINSQNGGSGGSGGGNNAGGKTLPRSAFFQLDPAAQMATVKDGVEIID